MSNDTLPVLPPPIVNSTLMQNYRLESPVSVSGQIATVQDSEGELVVFSISTGNNVFCFRPDEKSDTGWSQTDIGLEATQFAAGLTSDGNLIAITCSGTNLVYVEEDSATRSWGSQPPIPTQFTVPLDYVKARNLSGKLYLVLYASMDGSGAPPFFQDVLRLEGRKLTSCTDLDIQGWVVDDLSIEVGIDDLGKLTSYSIITPQLFIKTTNQYDNLYIDRGSGVPMYLSLWRPIPPHGFDLVGDLAVGGTNDTAYNQPSKPIITVMSVDDPLGPPVITHPKGFTQVWNDRHSGAKADGSTWQIDPPDGYAALGDAAASGYDAPELNTFVCVRNEFCGPAFAYQETSGGCDDGYEEVQGCNALMIYNNHSKKPKKGIQKLSIDSLAPSEGCLPAYTFHSHRDYGGNEWPFFALLTAPPLQSVIIVRNEGDSLVKLDVESPLWVLTHSVVENKDGATEIFATLSDHKLYYLDRAAKQWVCLDKSLPYSNLSASVDYGGLLEVFAISMVSRLLYYVSQESANSNAWGQKIVLKPDKQFVNVTAGRDKDGNSFAFGVTTDNLLFRFYKDPKTTDWISEEIEYQSTGEMDEIRTYTTEITFVDPDGVTIPNAEVKIWSEDVTPATINNRSYLLDPEVHTPCLSNQAGLVTVVVETTSLYAPILKYWAKGMPEGSCYTVEPNIDIQDQLKNVDAAALIAGLGLETDEQKAKAEALTPSIKTAMSLIPERASFEARLPAHLRRKADLRGIRYFEKDDGRFPNRIDPALVPEQHWQIDFSSDPPVFRILQKEEAQAIIADSLAALPKVSDAFDWVDDLGDLVDEIIDDVATQITITVSALKDKIEAAIEVLIDGVRYVMHATIDLIEQAFSLVEAIFKEIGAAFEQLFKWLGFLFQWEDILLTRDVITHSLEQTLPFVSVAANHLNSNIQDLINNARGLIDDGVNSLNNQIVKNRSISQISQSFVPPKGDTNPGAAINMLLSPFMDNAPGKIRIRTNASALALSNELKDPLTNLIDKLLSESATFQSGEDFNRAFAYFAQIKDNPDQAVTLALEGLVQLLGAIANAGLEIAGRVINLIFEALAGAVQAFLALLELEWEVPFISQLYKNYILPLDPSKKPLNALNLFSLFVAVPSTVVYKAINNTAPFDKQGVQDFKNNYTTDWLTQMSGWGTATRAVAPAIASDPEPWRVELSKTFGALYGGTYFIFGPLEAALDAWPPDSPVSPPAQISQATLVLEWMSWMFTLPWASDPANTSGAKCPGTADEFVNLIWTMSFYGPLIDLIMCLMSSQLDNKKEGTLLRNYNDGTLVMDWVLGCIGLILLAVEAAKKEGKPAYQFTQSFIAAIPSGFKILRLSKLAKQSKGITLVILAALDLLADESVAIMQFVGPNAALHEREV